MRVKARCEALPRTARAQARGMLALGPVNHANPRLPPGLNAS